MQVLHQLLLVANVPELAGYQLVYQDALANNSSSDAAAVVYDRE